MWFLALGLSCFAAVLGQIFYFRPQTVFVSQLFLQVRRARPTALLKLCIDLIPRLTQVIAFILGKAWAKVLPKADKGRFWAFLNPCDFNIKEHVAIRKHITSGPSNHVAYALWSLVIMSSTASDSALAISVFAANELYYDITPNYGEASEL